VTSESTLGATRFVDCSLERHGPAILDILNEVIANSTAIYDYVPRPASSMEGWFRAKATENHPVIGIETGDGQLAGFATYGNFRAWPAYKYAVENSVYVRSDLRRRGFGDLLLERLIQVAIERDRHTLIAGIDAANGGSIALHERHGFRHVATIRECGFKFGGWLDLAFYQLVLPTPSHPVDGA